ncbi:di-heme oxidoredictase family protein [Flavobacterium sp.]|uniref:di-heme oxidoreductase family protein n=1 Tax=Flavobacterium sp. TaxID=239 RepID=UPI00262A1685|nr:di-heme oxidoredictase family protein [Flavobacterium sp.]
MIRKLYLLPLLLITMYSCTGNDDSEYENINLEERVDAGGETTIYSTTTNAYSSPAPNLTGAEYDNHFEGDLLFEATFVTAPATVNPGLGSIYNNSACINCHPRDGRAKHPTDVNSANGLLVRASIFGTDEHGGPVAVPGFGLQIQNRAISGYAPEAAYTVSYTTQTETFADGTTVVLRKPTIALSNPYTSLPGGVMLSTRLGTPIFGLGLLEEIPETNILAQQDLSDADGDGISGKANYVWNPFTLRTELGRFGWKANTASIIVQCASAYVEDMGITNPIFTLETGHGQTNGGIPGLEPEVTMETLEKIALYCKTLGVPAARNTDKPSVKRGARLFEQLECAKCHTPKQVTGNSSIIALRNQTFYPYTDLLVHDMGEGLADNRPDFMATGTEWKTRPLWGIGLTNLVNGHTDFLHDGRAKNVEEAILWHGGEAEKSKTKYKNLNATQRSELLEFINSL